MAKVGLPQKWRGNIAENFNRPVGHMNFTDDRQTDGRTVIYSERERKFTYPKNYRRTTLNNIIGRGMPWHTFHSSPDEY